jgi:hypothetical protein
MIILTGPVPGTAAANTGLQPSTIESGLPVQVGTNITVASGSSTGPQTSVFALQPAPGGGPRTLTIAAQGIGAIPTAINANLLVSYDNGNTWQLYSAAGTAMPLFAAGVGTNFPVPNVDAGPLFALSCSGTFTLGGASGVNLIVTLS